MKRFKTLILLVLFLGACGDSGKSPENTDVISGGTVSTPLSTNNPDLLCDDVSLLMECSDEYKGLEVKEWLSFFRYQLNDDYEYKIKVGLESQLFECGSLLSSKAQMVFGGFLYGVIESELYEIFKKFIDIETCTAVENIEAVFRKELESL